MGDVCTDSDWWGNSATPWSLAASHGLIRLDELHWHLSYLNDCVYLSISPLFPLPQPLALLLHPPAVQRSRCSSRTRPRRMTPLWACAPLLWTGSLGLYCRGVTSQVAAKRDLGANENIFYWRQTRGNGEWLTKAASRCQRSKHHTNRNTPVATRVTVKLGGWNEFVWQPLKWKKKLTSTTCYLLTYRWFLRFVDTSEVCSKSCHDRRINRCSETSDLFLGGEQLASWSLISWFLRGILPALTPTSSPQQPLCTALPRRPSECARRCFKGPLGCHFDRRQDKWRLGAAIPDSCRQDATPAGSEGQRRHWPWLYKAKSQV